MKSLSVTFIAALALGTAATIVALQGNPGFGAVRLGPWTCWPQLGGSDIDPYARAVVAVDGVLPLGSGEGLAFSAETDQSGESLDSRCDYAISGEAPTGRFWTLTAYDVNGRLRPNRAGRYGVTSASLLRKADGSFTITAAREARPGNWLPLGEKSRFILVLRLYQPNSVAVGDAFDGMVMPTITRGACS
jgi:hypothetical protein